ncbi:ricin-type beta-trefoil lectin domain protein [Psychromonas sp. KJ10-2]|uniref:ricin-type beta-trefoil lectin domain protein n=1 Tax=Psychromonas sp. KJ10-2 TaxID=3391822 RepID=UPI0039B4B6E0
MPEFNVCAQVTEAIEGAQVTLHNCDQNKLQQISLLGDGTIRPLADESLCFTASLSTRRGLQGTSNHQIKDLTLHKCSPDRAIFQQWFTRTGI